MKKVFYLCIKAGSCSQFTVGKEYACKENYFVVDDGGYSVHLGQSCRVFYFGHELERIEREVFTAHGFEWFSHVPGDPMPTDASTPVYALFRNGVPSRESRRANNWRWKTAASSQNERLDIIGWRYYDSAPAQPALADWTEYPHSTAGQTFTPKVDARAEFFTAGALKLAAEFMGLDDLPGPSLPQDGEIHSVSIMRQGVWHTYNFANPDALLPPEREFMNAISERALNAMVADAEPAKCPDNMGVSKPVIDEWIKREDEHEAKQEAAKEALAKSEQEKSDRLKRDGEALVRDFDNQHDHRMGWVHK